MQSYLANATNSSSSLLPSSPGDIPERYKHKYIWDASTFPSESGPGSSCPYVYVEDRFVVQNQEKALLEMGLEIPMIGHAWPNGFPEPFEGRTGPYSVGRLGRMKIEFTTFRDNEEVIFGIQLFGKSGANSFFFAIDDMQEESEAYELDAQADVVGGVWKKIEIEDGVTNPAGAFLIENAGQHFLSFRTREMGCLIRAVSIMSGRAVFNGCNSEFPTVTTAEDEANDLLLPGTTYLPGPMAMTPTHAAECSQACETSMEVLLPQIRDQVHLLHGIGCIVYQTRTPYDEHLQTSLTYDLVQRYIEHPDLVDFRKLLFVNNFFFLPEITDRFSFTAADHICGRYNIEPRNAETNPDSPFECAHEASILGLRGFPPTPLNTTLSRRFTFTSQDRQDLWVRDVLQQLQNHGAKRMLLTSIWRRVDSGNSKYFKGLQQWTWSALHYCRALNFEVCEYSMPPTDYVMQSSWLMYHLREVRPDVIFFANAERIRMFEIEAKLMESAYRPKAVVWPVQTHPNSGGSYYPLGDSRALPGQQMGYYIVKGLRSYGWYGDALLADFVVQLTQQRSSLSNENNSTSVNSDDENKNSIIFTSSFTNSRHDFEDPDKGQGQDLSAFLQTVQIVFQHRPLANPRFFLDDQTNYNYVVGHINSGQLLGTSIFGLLKFEQSSGMLDTTYGDLPITWQLQSYPNFEINTIFPLRFQTDALVYPAPAAAKTCPPNTFMKFDPTACYLCEHACEACPLHTTTDGKSDANLRECACQPGYYESGNFTLYSEQDRMNMVIAYCEGKQGWTLESPYLPAGDDASWRYYENWAPWLEEYSGQISFSSTGGGQQEDQDTNTATLLDTVCLDLLERVKYEYRDPQLYEDFKALETLGDFVFDITKLRINDTRLGKLGDGRGYFYNDLHEGDHLKYGAIAGPMVFCMDVNKCFGSVCEVCPPGTFKAFSSVPVRDPTGRDVEPSRLELELERNTCKPCPLGTHYPQEGGTLCLPCAKGTYSGTVEGASVCLPCPLGYFQDEVGRPTCRKCVGAHETTTKEGAVSEAECVCEQNMYRRRRKRRGSSGEIISSSDDSEASSSSALIISSPRGDCIPCRSQKGGVSCVQGGELAYNLPGFVVLGSDAAFGEELFAWRCFSEFVCPSKAVSEERDTCPTGSRGIGCGECLQGYYLASSSAGCKKCGAQSVGEENNNVLKSLLSESGTHVILLTLLALAVFYAVWYSSCPWMLQNVMVKIRLDMLALRYFTTISFHLSHIQTFWIIASVKGADDVLRQPGLGIATAPGEYLNFRSYISPECWVADDGAASEGEGESSVALASGSEAASPAMSAADVAVSMTLGVVLAPALLIGMAIVVKVAGKALFPRKRGGNSTATNGQHDDNNLTGMISADFSYNTKLGLSRPSTTRLIRLLLNIFDTFFLVITNSVLLVFRSYGSHPAPNADERSLYFAPGVLASSPAGQSVTALSLVAGVLWCGGYVSVMFLLFWLQSQQYLGWDDGVMEDDDASGAGIIGMTGGRPSGPQRATFTQGISGVTSQKMTSPPSPSQKQMGKVLTLESQKEDIMNKKKGPPSVVSGGGAGGSTDSLGDMAVYYGPSFVSPSFMQNIYEQAGLILMPYFTRYTDNYPWFGMAILLRRFLLVACATMFDSADLQLSGILLILVISIYVNENFVVFRFTVLKQADTNPQYLQVLVAVAVLVSLPDSSSGGGGNIVDTTGVVLDGNNSGSSSSFGASASSAEVRVLTEETVSANNINGSSSAVIDLIVNNGTNAAGTSAIEEEAITTTVAAVDDQRENIISICLFLIVMFSHIKSIVAILVAGKRYVAALRSTNELANFERKQLEALNRSPSAWSSDQLPGDDPLQQESGGPATANSVVPSSVPSVQGQGVTASVLAGGLTSVPTAATTGTGGTLSIATGGGGGGTNTTSVLPFPSAATTTTGAQSTALFQPMNSFAVKTRQCLGELRGKINSHTDNAFVVWYVAFCKMGADFARNWRNTGVASQNWSSELSRHMDDLYRLRDEDEHGGTASEKNRRGGGGSGDLMSARIQDAHHIIEAMADQDLDGLLKPFANALIEVPRAGDSAKSSGHQLGGFMDYGKLRTILVNMDRHERGKSN